MCLTTYNNVLKASIRLCRFLYHKTTRELGYDKIGVIRDNERGLITDKEREELSLKIDNAYLKHITSCSERTLKAILDAHELGFQRRANRTIEAIKTELLERALLHEDQPQEGK